MIEDPWITHVKLRFLSVPLPAAAAASIVVELVMDESASDPESEENGAGPAPPVEAG